VWPSPADGKVVITPAQLGMLLEGIDWRIRGGPGGRLWPDELWQSESAAILVAPRAAGHDSMSGCRSRPISFPTMHKR
jgi:transposase